MGERLKMQSNLAFLMRTIGRGSTKHLPRLTHKTIIKSDCADAVEQVYRSLGGVLDMEEVSIKPGPWDFEDCGVAIELDEEQHFNRYRRITLQSTVYSKLASFPLTEYRSMCQQFEGECLDKADNRGYWKNSRCEVQFGQAGKNGDLTGAGAPRWKQRAFCDFIKDLTYLIIGTKCVRVSIWDTVVVGGRRLLIRDALLKRNVDAACPIWSLIESRV